MRTVKVTHVTGSRWKDSIAKPRVFIVYVYWKIILLIFAFKLPFPRKNKCSRVKISDLDVQHWSIKLQFTLGL